MDLHDIAASEDDIDDVSSSSGTNEDESDPSSMLDSDAAPVDQSEHDKRRKAFIEREEKHVRKVRRAVAVAILTFAVVVSSSVFVLARNKEHETFTQEVCWYLALALALLIDGLEKKTNERLSLSKRYLV
jgi:hypothetical protein